MTDKSVKVDDIQRCMSSDSISSLFISQFKEDNSEYYKTVDTNKEKQANSTPNKQVMSCKKRITDTPARVKKETIKELAEYVISKAREYYPKEFTDTAGESGVNMKKQVPYPYYSYGGKIIFFDIRHCCYKSMDIKGAIYTLESYYGIELKPSYQSQYTAENIIREICLKSKPVDYYGNIGGYSGGVYEVLGDKLAIIPKTTPILQAAPLIPHEKGECLYWDKWKPLYDNIFYPMFVCGADMRQLDYVFKWLAGARAYVSGRTSLKMPCLQICGDVCTGKTLFGDICNALLTGQKSNPSSYLHGETSFNSHLIGATLLLIDDQCVNANRTTNRIKEMIVGSGMQVSEKYVASQPILYPRYVMMILANKDDISRKTLISIRSDTEDKVSLLETVGKVTEMEREVRWKMIEEALPYFAAYLDYEVYPTLSHKGRMIVPAWQYSEAVEMIFEDTAEGQLWHHLTAMLEGVKGCNPLYDKPMVASEWKKYLDKYKELHSVSVKYVIPSREQIGKMLRKLASLDKLKGCIEVGKRTGWGTPYTIHKIIEA